MYLSFNPLFEETVLVTVSLQIVPEPVLRKETLSSADFLVCLSITCEDLRILTNYAVSVLPLSEFWKLVQKNELDELLCRKLMLRSLGRKKYAQTLHAVLSMHERCACGLYKEPRVF
jgi:hypothetical protein